MKLLGCDGMESALRGGSASICGSSGGFCFSQMSSSLCSSFSRLASPASSLKDRKRISYPASQCRLGGLRETFAGAGMGRQRPTRQHKELLTAMPEKLSPGVQCAASVGDAGADSDGLVELPLFPLPLVLFPGAVLPLQIFEYRYRILMHTLLQTDLRFGIVYCGEKNSTAATVGCIGEVFKHERLPDDRFFVICRGQERFRVKEIVRNRPYLVGRVEWLEDRPSGSALSADPLSLTEEGRPKSELEGLADEVENLMKDVIRLSHKMSGRDEPPASDLRKSAFPTPFSFWVASTFEGAPSEQQALLELEDTAERLRRERDTLRNTLNYLTAATAVKDAFASPE
eukprot:TRINITY_DN17814_c0_g1_i1.p1 TRINITY_DN17814_c0_g1~~TRINITY_DN17814_c0_g1_i1.p1  ORF type:complete len:343 (-),score=29.80 TRINITY_DN17814_c0_g1_i1:933-1961(-)